uniref:Uncharacterized protein n=1 Tax=Cacopsylla melanoneura TaxID=428564 RepID=A0A8D9EHT9_9HEMI
MLKYLLSVMTKMVKYFFDELFVLLVCTPRGIIMDRRGMKTVSCMANESNVLVQYQQTKNKTPKTAPYITFLSPSRGYRKVSRQHGPQDGLRLQMKSILSKIPNPPCPRNMVCSRLGASCVPFLRA